MAASGDVTNPNQLSCAGVQGSQCMFRSSLNAIVTHIRARV